MLARTLIQRAGLFPCCHDHFVRNATRLPRREFPCYVGDIQPLTAYPTIPLALGRDRFDSTASAGRRIPSASPIDLPEPIPEDPLPSSTPLRGRR